MHTTLAEKQDYVPENEYFRLKTDVVRVVPTDGREPFLLDYTVWYCTVDGTTVVNRQQHDEFLKGCAMTVMLRSNLVGSYGTTH
jgi:hypothetical protein